MASHISRPCQCLTYNYDVDHTYGHSALLLLNEDESKLLDESDGNDGRAIWDTFGRLPVRVCSGHGNDSTEVQAKLANTKSITRVTYDEMQVSLQWIEISRQLAERAKEILDELREEAEENAREAAEDAKVAAELAAEEGDE